MRYQKSKKDGHLETSFLKNTPEFEDWIEANLRVISLNYCRNTLGDRIKELISYFTYPTLLVTEVL